MRTGKIETLSTEEKKILVQLAKEAIKNYSTAKTIKINANEGDISKRLKEKRGVFVSVYVKGELRGCIGTFEKKPIYLSVPECAVKASFFDLRFNSVSEDEFNEVEVEISLLTEPERLSYIDYNDLLKKLNNDMGVVLEKDGREATYLPQVWEKLPDKEEFLGTLCMKAGLHQDAWKEEGLVIKTYRVEVFKG